MNAVLIGVTAVLVLLVGIYAIGFQRGSSSADRPINAGDLGPFSLDPPTTIRDPIANPGRLTPSPTNTTPDRGATTPPTPESRSPAGRVVAIDPRQNDVNYFELDVLAYRDAEEAVRFLSDNGLPAAAVPQRGVELADAQAKNRPCIVFVLEGIPSVLYRTDDGQRIRQRIEPDVRRLGQAWRNQQRGASTFAQAYWRKFQSTR